MFAHIYKGRGGVWQVLVTIDASIVGATPKFEGTKAECKAWAKANNLKPHNY